MRETEVIRDFREKNKGRSALLEHEVKGMLRRMGLPVPKGIFIGRGEKIPEQPELTFPLVAKVSSSRIISKTDVGGVRVNIRNRDELNRAFGELSLIESAEGVLVEEMAPQGIEAIIGGIIDNQFGPVVMFGLGGIFVELFKDVAFGLAPLSTNDALWLIAQVKGCRLLEGYRGMRPIDKQRLAGMVVNVSEVIATGLVAEIDLNPVALYPEGAMILDAKMQILS
jgi:acetyl-CoA synthetase (ADP-forming)